MPKPDYNVCVKRVSDSSPFAQVGAAWLNPKGHIKIRLHPCVQLADTFDVAIYLFPNDKDRPKKIYHPPPAEPSGTPFEYGPPPMDDDDIPF